MFDAQCLGDRPVVDVHPGVAPAVRDALERHARFDQNALDSRGARPAANAAAGLVVSLFLHQHDRIGIRRVADFCLDNQVFGTSAAVVEAGVRRLQVIEQAEVQITSK